MSTGEKASRNDVVVGFISAPKDEAPKLAEKLVREKLVACAQVTGGIESYYWWEGKVEHEPEVLIIIKTKAALREKVATFVKREHSYEVPECVFLPAAGGIKEYLRWVGEVTSPAD